MNKNEMFWLKQHDLYRKQPYDPKIRYESWQPCRWAANRAAVQLLLPMLKNVKEICEIGAGSAAFSFEMQKQSGVSVIGIDQCGSAKQYAERIASDMGLCIDYRKEDLFSSAVKSDLILSLGVIEHFDTKKQREFIQKCREMSSRYVLVAIPNQESPIFRNYIKWANDDFQPYEEKHLPLSTNDLVRLCNENGLHVIHTDGFQVFLSEHQFWVETKPDDIPLNRKLKLNLIKEDKKWNSFPCIDFTYEDIPTLVKCEISLKREERLSNGFMTYVLAVREN